MAQLELLAQGCDADSADHQQDETTTPPNHSELHETRRLEQTNNDIIYLD
jgi:hypothetical protein